MVLWRCRMTIATARTQIHVVAIWRSWTSPDPCDGWHSVYSLRAVVREQDSESGEDVINLLRIHLASGKAHRVRRSTSGVPSDQCVHRR